MQAAIPLLLSLFACGAGEEDSATDTGTIGWWYDPSETTDVAEWSANEAAAALQAVADAPMPGCNEIIAAWLRYFAMDDGTCMAGTPGGLSDDAGCTMANGVWVRGQTDYRYEEVPEESHMEHVVNLDVDIVWPETEDAAAYQGACGCNGAIEPPGERYLEAEGTWRDPTAEEWFADGVEGMWQVTARDQGEGQSVELSGGIAWGEGTWVYFDGFHADPTGCASGVAQLRDPAGGWWTLDHGDGCEPCGTLSFGDAPEGAACVDWTGLITYWSDALWNQEPWE